jgi:hypothetical protein
MAPALVSVPTVSPPVSQNLLALNGTVSGTFVTTLTPGPNGTAGTTTTFNGSGTITGLGQVTVTGTLATLFSASGTVSTVETFTFTAAKGTVSIQITNSASAAGGSATAPSTFSIIKATGAFAGDVGFGTAVLQMTKELVPVSPPTVAKGVFTLTLKSLTGVA